MRDTTIIAVPGYFATDLKVFQRIGRLCNVGRSFCDSIRPKCIQKQSIGFWIFPESHAVKVLVADTAAG